MKIKKKRSEPVKETQMVSLADIAFLIIFFFMLSSQFMKDRTELTLPKLPETTETKSEITVTLDRDSHLTLNGDVIEGSSIRERADALETELRKLLDKKPKAPSTEREVRFRCDQTVKYESYHPIYLAISNAGGSLAIMQDVQ